MDASAAAPKDDGGSKVFTYGLSSTQIFGGIYRS